MWQAHYGDIIKREAQLSVNHSDSLLMHLIYILSGTLAIWASVRFNPDVLSPAKLYLGLLTVTSLDLLVSPYPANVYFTTLLLFGVGVAAGFIEYTRIPSRVHFEPVHISATYFRSPAFLWLISAPSIAAQIYLMSYFGGVDGYIRALSVRSLAFRSVIPFLELARIVNVINVAYFAILVSTHAPKRSWIAFWLHATLALAIVALSGSRIHIVIQIIAMILVWHYLRRPVRASLLVSVAAALLVITSIIGAVRLNQHGGKSFFDSGLSADEKDGLSAHYSYTVSPLMMVLSREDVPLQYGTTFLTAVTNLVPRALWPDKPDQAGVVVTIEYLGNPWHGTSYVNLGLVGEAIVNFGVTGGLLLGPILTLTLLALAIRNYRRIRVSRSPKKVFWAVFLHCWIMPAVTTTCFSESGVNGPTFILNCLTFFVLRLLLVHRPFYSCDRLIQSSTGIVARQRLVYK